MAVPASVHGVPTTETLANGFIPVGLFAVNTASGAALVSSTAATNIEGALLPFQGFTGTAGTIPAGHLNSLGKAFRVRAGGIIANTSTPNLTVAVLLGTTVIATTGVVASVAITGTSNFSVDVVGVVTAVGSSGTVMTNGKFNYFSTAPVAVQWGIGNTTPGTADTVDLTAAKAVHLQATWGTSSASNTLTCTFFSFEFLN